MKFRLSIDKSLSMRTVIDLSKVHSGYLGNTGTLLYAMLEKE